MVLKFYDFLNLQLSEKMGVPLRIDQQNDDPMKISEIVNSFMDNISKNPDKEYKTCEKVFDRGVDITYKPKDIHSGAVTSKDGLYILIEKKLTNFNYLEVKYILIHELVHSFQKIKLYHKKTDIDPLDKIKEMLLRPSIQELENNNKYLPYLIYREYIYEISGWTNDAYLIAYKHKMNNPELPNNEIVQSTFFDLYLNKKTLEDTIHEIKTDDETFISIVTMMIGQFSELKTNMTNQSYFDRSVFELPVVKHMKNQVSIIMKDSHDCEEIKGAISQIIDLNMSKLLNDKQIIIESFIKHLEYWFEIARKRMGKAIQLGIDDATIKLNN